MSSVTRGHGVIALLCSKVYRGSRVGYGEPSFVYFCWSTLWQWEGVQSRSFGVLELELKKDLVHIWEASAHGAD